jgi:hypothetical protein
MRVIYDPIAHPGALHTRAGKLNTPSLLVTPRGTQISVARVAAEASHDSMGYSTAPEGHLSTLSSATAATEMPSDDEDLAYGSGAFGNMPTAATRCERDGDWVDGEGGVVQAAKEGG